MKKLAYMMVALLVSTFVASCSKDEIGGTASQDMAGQWYVRADVVIDGTVYEDAFGMGRFIILTYNTAANDGKELYVDDQENFWAFKVRTLSDLSAKTFATDGEVDNESYPCKVTITNGKILPKAGRQNNGSPADSITFDVQFDDDENGFTYRLQGVRYSGLEENL